MLPTVVALQSETGAIGTLHLALALQVSPSLSALGWVIPAEHIVLPLGVT